MDKKVIEINDLYVAYGETKAVNGISLTIYAGECFGLLGPNGAGKTTLLSCLEGLKQPDRGTIMVAGLNALKEHQKVKRLLGVQLQNTSLFPDLNCAEIIELFASFYNIFLSRKLIMEYLTRFKLQEKAKAKADELSGGQRQRLALAIALVHHPSIIVLDESTTGLDPQARRSIWESIRQICADGSTVILTTHAMEEAEALCGRVGIIDHGKIIALATPQALTSQMGQTVTLSAEVDLSDEQIAQRRALPNVQTVIYTKPLLSIQTSQPQQTLNDLQLLAAGVGCSLRQVNIRQPNLEDVFLAITGRSIRD